MTKEAAIHKFFNNFGIPAFPASSAPNDAFPPYITYGLVTDNWMGGNASIVVNVWFYTTDESAPNAVARELSEAIGYGGKCLDCDGGFVWLKRGSPWCQSLYDNTDDKIKRRYINVLAEYNTPD